MFYTIPDYYPDFRCAGGACPSTCCGGWQISIDPASLKKYRHARQPLRSRLENEINWSQACFRQYQGRCAFLNEENLCDLYLEGGGESALCRACHIYPRHVEEFADVREFSLSLSCPIVAKQLLHHEKPIHFRTKKDKQEKLCKNFDFSLFAHLTRTRKQMFQILQNRTKPFALRAAIVLSLAHDLQQRIDRNALSDTGRLRDRYRSPHVWSWFENRLRALSPSREQQFHARRELFSLLEQLHPLRRDWIPYLKNARSSWEAPGLQSPKSDSRFREFFTETMMEQLMIYFIYTYFCGAVYSRDAYTETKFAFVSVILIRELARAGWLGHPSDASSDLIAEAAFRLSREIEHSDQNQLKMKQLLAREDRFGLEQLFCLL